MPTACALSEGDARFVNRLYQAYIGLKIALPRADGMRMVRLARFGAFEVRLFELAGDRSPDADDFWAELYRYDTRSSLDCRRCRDMDEAEDITAELMRRARQLDESSRPPERSLDI